MWHLEKRYRDADGEDGLVGSVGGGEGEADGKVV